MNARTVIASVDCPRCGRSLEVTAILTGPTHDRDPEFTTPTQHMGCPPYTYRERETLCGMIYDEARDLDHQAQRNEDGPQDDRHLFSDTPSYAEQCAAARAFK